MIDFTKLRLPRIGELVKASPDSGSENEAPCINGRPVDLSTPAGELVAVTAAKFAEAMENYLLSVGEG